MSVFPSKLFWIGEENKHPVMKNRERDLVMDSAIHYYASRTPKLKYYPGRLFLDSGAFTAAMRNLELDKEKVAEIQERLSPDLVIPLDYPIKPGMSIEAMRSSWEKTRNNILYWLENTSLSNKTVPTLHSWDRNSLISNIRWLSKTCDSDFLAIGVVVTPEFTHFNGFFKDRQPSIEFIRMLSIAIEEVKRRTDFRVHVMGLGSSPLMLHIAYWLGVDSTDSSGYRRKAAFGKIVLPGKGERYIGNRYGSFGRRYLTKRELEILSQCTCLVCLTDQSKLWYDWKARAIHNEHVMKAEANTAHELMTRGVDVYEKYLDKIFSNSKFGLDYLWRYAKLIRKYPKIETIMR
jgi:7-cyano-7-deazaguanine tRNA-ribosyltransferase